MTPDQTARCLAFLASAWPWITPSAETTAVWADTLTDVPVEAARVVAKALVAECEQFPSLATFRDRCRAEMNRSRPEQDLERRSLPSGEAPVDAARARELIAQMRTALKSTKEL